MLNDIRKPKAERTELIVEPIKNEKGYYTGYLHKGELIRCRDCKHYDAGDVEHEYDRCRHHWSEVGEDDFCSRGERRE